MNNPIIFDCDCLSAFLWVNKQDMLCELYKEPIIIPNQVYKELSASKNISHLKERIDSLIENGNAQIYDMEVNSKEYALYSKLTSNPDKGHKFIGEGEAAAISLAKQNKGTLASNNLRDVSTYVSEYELNHVTTGDILFKAMNDGIITETEGNEIWKQMISKKRKLGYNTFSDYIKHL